MYSRIIHLSNVGVGRVFVRRRIDVSRVSVTSYGVEIGQDYTFTIRPIRNNGWELGVVTPSGYVSIAEYYDKGYIERNGDYQTKSGELHFSSHKTDVVFKGRSRRGHLTGVVEIRSSAFPSMWAKVDLKHPHYAPAPKVKRYAR